MPTRKGIRVSVWRQGRDHNGHIGLFGNFDQLILVGKGIPAVVESSEEYPLVELRAKSISAEFLRMVGENPRGGKYYYVEPYMDPPADYTHWMFGGAFVWSSDSRFPFNYPLGLHDRAEDDRGRVLRMG
jgi:hypothetical protein